MIRRLSRRARVAALLGGLLAGAAIVGGWWWISDQLEDRREAEADRDEAVDELATALRSQANLRRQSLDTVDRLAGEIGRLRQLVEDLGGDPGPPPVIPRPPSDGTSPTTTTTTTRPPASPPPTDRPPPTRPRPPTPPPECDSVEIAGRCVPLPPRL